MQNLNNGDLQKFLLNNALEILDKKQTLSLTIDQFNEIRLKVNHDLELSKQNRANLKVLINNIKMLKLSNDSKSVATIELSDFKKLESLQLNKIDVAKVDFQSFYENLNELICTSCKTSKIDDIFDKCINRWKQLRTLFYQYSLMKSISDDVLTKIRYVEYLDLSFNKINEFSTKINLPNLKYLNLSYNRLSKIPYFGQHFSNRLQILILKCNLISNLELLHFYYYLWELDLEMNTISSRDNLKQLSSLSSLQRLQLSNNPISHDVNYRTTVLSFLSKTVQEFNFIFDNERLSKNDIHNLGKNCSDNFDYSTNNPNVAIVHEIQNTSSSYQTKNEHVTEITNDDNSNCNDDDIEILQSSTIDNDYYDVDFETSTPVLAQFEADLLKGVYPEFFQNLEHEVFPTLSNEIVHNFENDVFHNFGNEMVPNLENDVAQDLENEVKLNEGSILKMCDDDDDVEILNQSLNTTTNTLPKDSETEFTDFATINDHLKLFFYVTLFENRGEDLVWYLNGVIVYRGYDLNSFNRGDILFDGMLVLTTRKLYILRVRDTSFDLNNIACYENNDISGVLVKVHSVTMDRLQGIGCLPWKQGVYIDTQRNRVFENEICCLCITENFYVTNDFISYLFYKKCLPDNCKIIFETTDHIKTHMSMLMAANNFESNDLRLLTTINLFSMNRDSNEYYIVTLLITDKDLFIVLNHNEQLVLKQNEPIFPTDFLILSHQSIDNITDKTLDTKTGKNFLILNFSDHTEWRLTVKNVTSMDWILSNLNFSTT